MRDYGIDRGLVQERDDSIKNQKGFSLGFWGFRKMFRDYLTKLNVPFFDTCCPETSTENKYPVRYDDTSGLFEYFDGIEWIEIGSGGGE